MNLAKKKSDADSVQSDWGMYSPPAMPAPAQHAPPVVEPAVITGYMPGTPAQPGYNQMIAIGNASPHLPFKDWMARGVVSGLGRLVAWPFKLIGDIVQAIAMAIIGILKMILIIILIPSAIIIGLKIAAMQQEEDTIRGSAAAAVEGVVEAGDGAYNGRKTPADLIAE